MFDYDDRQMERAERDRRDLELLAKVRAHQGAPAVRAELEQMAGDLEFGGGASEAAGLALQLLAPGDGAG